MFPKIKYNTNGKATPPIIEDNETILEENNTIKNTNNDKQQESGKIHITIPKIVATPFPPLNPAKTGKICPTKAAIPRANCRFTNSSLSKTYGLRKANETAKAPFMPF